MDKVIVNGYTYELCEHYNNGKCTKPKDIVCGWRCVLTEDICGNMLYPLILALIQERQSKEQAEYMQSKIHDAYAEFYVGDTTASILELEKEKYELVKVIREIKEYLDKNIKTRGYAGGFRYTVNSMPLIPVRKIIDKVRV